MTLSTNMPSHPVDDEKHNAKDPMADSQNGYKGSQDEEVGVVAKGEPLKRDLRSRHMQMIAIGMPLFPAGSGSSGDADFMSQVVPSELVSSSVPAVL